MQVQGLGFRVQKLYLQGGKLPFDPVASGAPAHRGHKHINNQVWISITHLMSEFQRPSNIEYGI